MNKPPDILREAVLAALRRRGMSPTAFGYEMHRAHRMSVNTVVRWLTGRGNAKDTSINPMLDYLDLTVGEK